MKDVDGWRIASDGAAQVRRQVMGGKLTRAKATATRTVDPEAVIRFALPTV